MHVRSAIPARAAALASLLLLLAGPAAAGEVYLGVGYGQGRADFDTLGDTLADDREATGLEFFTGYRLGFLAVEAFYADLGNYSATVQTGAGTVAATADVDGYGAALMLFVPLGEKTELFAKGGVFRWDVDSNVGRDHDADPMYGLGLYLRGMGPNAALRIQYERFKDAGAGAFAGSTEGIDIDLLTVGIIYNF